MFSKFLLSVVFFLALLRSALTLELNIAPDTSLRDGQLSFSSKCDFIEPPSDAQFLKMIQVAYNQMKPPPDEAKRQGISNKQLQKRPNAMIGLSIGNQVYLSSSLKGSKQIIYQNSSWDGGNGEFNKDLPERFNGVKAALDRCSTETAKQHRNQAACGEIMSTLLWMADNPTLDPSKQKVRVAAFSKERYLAPCSPTEKDPEGVSWGCDKWTQEMGYTVVNNMSLPDAITVQGTCRGPLSLNACLLIESNEGQT
ncbi:uncharacterized protein N7500_008969 [Penicillium coprophilum]|uniref:uncharacterized protein n=1 Tax=Penicillium coprophilum TaxID=36646 RepID=UPI00238BEB07|nr:uncharacterized protein N7500_008969 [Penicillium coprophilum]KAJ5159318.1 hypothetical protein N7500_008969 [Penicillium coprophilum]